MAKTLQEITLRYSQEQTRITKNCKRRQRQLQEVRLAALMGIPEAKTALQTFEGSRSSADAARQEAVERMRHAQEDAEAQARAERTEGLAEADVEFNAADYQNQYEEAKAEAEWVYRRTLKDTNVSAPVVTSDPIGGLNTRQAERQRAREIRRKALEKAKREFRKAKAAALGKWQKQQVAVLNAEIKSFERARRDSEKAKKAAERAYESARDQAARQFRAAFVAISEAAVIEQEFAGKRQAAEARCQREKVDARQRMKAEIAAMKNS